MDDTDEKTNLRTRGSVRVALMIRNTPEDLPAITSRKADGVWFPISASCMPLQLPLLN